MRRSPNVVFLIGSRLLLGGCGDWMQLWNVGEYS